MILLFHLRSWPTFPHQLGFRLRSMAAMSTCYTSSCRDPLHCTEHNLFVQVLLILVIKKNTACNSHFTPSSWLRALYNVNLEPFAPGHECLFFSIHFKSRKLSMSQICLCYNKIYEQTIVWSAQPCFLVLPSAFSLSVRKPH